MTLKAAPQGAYAARHYVHDWMVNHFPGYLDDLRVAWDVDDTVLPYPVKYVPGPPGAIDLTPLLAVSAVYMSRVKRVDAAGDRIEYASTYMMRAFAFIIDERLQDAIDTRDLYSAALRSALLDSPTLKGAPLVLDDTTLREDYSDPKKRNGDRWMLGTMITFNMTVQESLLRTSLGTVGAVNLDVVPMTEITIHPALA